MAGWKLWSKHKTYQEALNNAKYVKRTIRRSRYDIQKTNRRFVLWVYIPGAC